MKKYLVFLLVALLSACSKPDPNRLRVGTIAGPETDLVLAAKAIALEKYGINVDVVAFSDYNLPNAALQDGSLDINIYQHQAYLDAAIKAHHYDLEVIGKTFVYPMGIYTNKIKTLSELPENALIAIPNDPSNEGRALLLLARTGFIQLKNAKPTSLQDILENPKNLRFKELDAAQLPRILPDVDAAIINTTFALPAGLSPARNALFMEDKSSPYANLIVIKQKSVKKSQIGVFLKAMQSDKIKEKAHALFGDAAVAAW